MFSCVFADRVPDTQVIGRVFTESDGAFIRLSRVNENAARRVRLMWAQMCTASAPTASTAAGVAIDITRFVWCLDLVFLLGPVSLDLL